MPYYKARLDAFRKAMKNMHCDAFIIPHGDIWEREEIEPSEQRFLYMSGLDATAGYVVVTQKEAAVLIDPRYTGLANTMVNQAVFEIGYYTETPPEAWLIERLKPNSIIGYDPWLHNCKEAKRMQKACNDAGIILQAEPTNPVDSIWEDRPKSWQYKAIAHDIKFAGKTVDDKLQDLAVTLQKNDVDSLIITAADSLGWLLNLRTLENPQSPGIRGFAIFQHGIKKLTIFTDVDCTAFDQTQSQIHEIDFLPLVEFKSAISFFERQEQIVQISESAPDWFTEHLNAPASEIINLPDPCEILKACKNETEQQGIRESHHRDAKAVKSVIEWVKNTHTLTEMDVADKLEEERAKQDHFRGLSFKTISGWNANAANIHRKITKENNTAITGNGLLLIDSGGQYDDGTTDITRVIPIGKITKDMQEHYTLVLKAHIALATAIFPEGTTGAQLDALVRAPLWQSGIDFAHGTGHGVGYFLNVHEGPCSISPKSQEPLREGMLLSNEPGFYKTGEYGIRLENLVLVKKCKEPDEDGNETGKKLLCFETVTKVPFEKECIIKALLTERERAWLDEYHKFCQA